MYVKYITLILALTFLAACNVSERVENTLPANADVGSDLIKVTFEAANIRHPKNQNLLDASAAQVVFSKIVKAGLLFGTPTARVT
jgi:nitrous oxide reductase accessory protein NosL